MRINGRLTVIALACSIARPNRTVAQEIGIPRRLTLPTLDLTVLATKRSGLTIYASPGIETNQGKDSSIVMTMALLPDSVDSWVNHAMGLMRLDSIPNASDGILWGNRIYTIDHRQYLAVGTEVKDRRAGKHRYLGLVSSAHVLRFELRPLDADSLLRLIYSAGISSGYDPPIRDSISLSVGGDSLRTATLDEPAQPLSQPAVQWQGRPGRVMLQFVVDTNGAVEPASLLVLLSTHPDLESEARRVILNSRFHPARFKGNPVRQLVTQVVAFRYR